MGKQRCALHTAVVAQCFVQAADAMQASHVNNCQPAIAAAETYCQQKMQRTQTKALGGRGGLRSQITVSSL
jgi:hypothetical protein